MAEVKRPNYFTSQFLVERDFQDEQAYHRHMRQQHNRLLHIWGVVTGLEVSRTGDSQVAITSGVAIDHLGHDIVLPADPPPSPLTLTGVNTTLAVTIAYRDVTDPSDRYQAGGVDNYSRITERPLLASTETPPSDGSVIVLAQVSLDANGTITTVDNTVRPLASSLIPAAATLPGPLTITGQHGNLTTTEGDLRIGNSIHRLKIGVTPIGADAGDVRIQAQGGTNRLLLGSATQDVLAVQADQASVSGDLTVTGNLQVAGKLQVEGDVIARARNVLLGTTDTDQVSIRGVLRSTHSSKALQVNDALHVTGRLTTGGSIGIGTNTPNRPLTIQSSGATYLNVRATNGTHELLVGADAGGGIVSTMTNHDLQLRAGGNIPRMTLKATGNIGMGTATPNRPLTIQTNGATYMNVRANDGTHELLLGADDGGGVVSTMTNHNLQLRAGGNITRMHINANGNIGIGTTTPGDRLDVNGDIRIRGGDIRDAGGTRRILMPDNGTLALRDAGGTTRLAIMDDGRLDLEDSNGNVALSVAANGRVGIGTTNPNGRFTVQGSHAGGTSTTSHLVYFNNTSTSTAADVLALRVGATSPNTATNFITFYKGDNSAIGRIEAQNGGNGTVYHGSGSDYAEFLPRLDPNEVIEPGDVVGIIGGKVTKKTTGAHYVMPITDRPVVLGNSPLTESEELYEKVAFIGQVSIKIRGPVQVGDYIVPSGLDDGVGLAVSTSNMTPAQYVQVIGRAWESSSEVTVKRVNAAVSLHSNYGWIEHLFTSVKVQQAEIQDLKVELQALKMQPCVS